MNKLIPDDSILVPENARLAFQGEIFAVYQWPQEMYDGSQHTFEMLKRTDTVNVIAVVNDDQIMVVEDEQPHLGKRRSFPGGRVDEIDNSIESAARREMQEETGYSFNNWRLIKVIQPYRKIEWFVYTWLAWDETNKQEQSLDPGEKISTQSLSFLEVKDLVSNDVDYLGDSRDIFKNLENIDGLLKLPEFNGKIVDR